jgi:hypothetical protein
MKSKIRWARHVACTGERKGAYTILVRQLEKRRPLGSGSEMEQDFIKCGEFLN